MATTMTVTLEKSKECKGSVRYETNDPEAPISNIYLSRAFSRPMPESVTVTVTDGANEGEK